MEQTAMTGGTWELKGARAARMAIAEIDAYRSDIAQLCGISPSMLTHVLKGRRRYSPLMRARIEMALAQMEAAQRDDGAEQPAPKPIPMISRL